MVEWCELGFGFVQQLAGQTANGSLEGLLDWVKVCVTNKSEVELHMLDGELLSPFAVFLGNLPRKDELAALVVWRRVFNHASAGRRGIDDRRGRSQSISWRKGLAPNRSSSYCPGDI